MEGAAHRLSSFGGADQNRVLNYALVASLAAHAVLLFGVSQRDPAKPLQSSGPLFARLVELQEPPPPKPEPVPRSEPEKPSARAAPLPRPRATPRPAPQPSEREALSAPPAPPAPAPAPAPFAEQSAAEPTSMPDMPAAPAQPPAAPTSQAAQGEVPDSRMLRLQYGIALKSELARQVKYPTVARREGWQGRGEVHLAIGDSGWIADLRVVRSTGNPVLDQAVVEGVRRAAPRVPIPPGLRGQRFELAIPFEMNLTEP